MTNTILAAACSLALLLAGCGDDSGGSGGGGASTGSGDSSCGTVDDPVLFTLADVSPAPGDVVAGAQVVHSFRIVDAPAVVQQLAFQATAAHTAGTTTPAQLTFTVTQEGADLVYTAAPVDWETVPGHVELTVASVYQVAGKCGYAFPSPLFSYDIAESGAGGAGGSGDGGGATGEGGASDGGGGAE